MADNIPAAATAYRLVLHVGRPYRYVSPRQPGLEGRLYRPLGFARHAHTRQDVVVYAGEDGPDAGRLFIATPDDWLRRFELVDHVGGQETKGTG